MYKSCRTLINPTECTDQLSSSSRIMSGPLQKILPIVFDNKIAILTRYQGSIQKYHFFHQYIFRKVGIPHGVWLATPAVAPVLRGLGGCAGRGRILASNQYRFGILVIGARRRTARSGSPYRRVAACICARANVRAMRAACAATVLARKFREVISHILLGWPAGCLPLAACRLPLAASLLRAADGAPYGDGRTGGRT